MNKNTQLNECKLKSPPNYLPQNLKKRIENIINAFKYARTNPYHHYFSKISPYRSKLAYKKMSEEQWTEYIKHLNRYNNCFSLISNLKMKSVWEKFDKIDGRYLGGLFTFISNRYNNLVDYQTTSFFKESSDIQKHLDGMHKIREDPSPFLSLLIAINDMFDQFWTLIAPDGSDCFEDMDLSDPKNKMYLDEDGNPPYKINWDLYIKDEEFFAFKETLEKIIEKLQNRIKYNNKERTITPFTK